MTSKSQSWNFWQSGCDLTSVGKDNIIPSLSLCMSAKYSSCKMKYQYPGQIPNVAVQHTGCKTMQTLP